MMLSNIPVLGFISAQYDLNVIKEHFVSVIPDTTKKVKVARKTNQIMVLGTRDFNFLDVMDYLAPGTSYGKSLEAYGCNLQKSWFPYEWFDSPYSWNILDYLTIQIGIQSRNMATYFHWKIECHIKKFKEKGMATFKDWLQYYNNLDVEPFIEALAKMRDFYQERGVDTLKSS